MSSCSSSCPAFLCASMPASKLQELPVACVRCQRGGACSRSLSLGGSCGLATSPSCTACDRPAVHRPLLVSFLGKAADRFEATSGASSPVSDFEFRLDLCKPRELNVEGVFRLKASEAASPSGEVMVSTRSLPLPLKSRSRRDPVRCPFYLLMTVLGTVTGRLCPNDSSACSIVGTPSYQVACLHQCSKRETKCRLCRFAERNV